MMVVCENCGSRMVVSVGRKRSVLDVGMVVSQDPVQCLECGHVTGRLQESGKARSGRCLLCGAPLRGGKRRVRFCDETCKKGWYAKKGIHMAWTRQDDIAYGDHETPLAMQAEDD